MLLVRYLLDSKATHFLLLLALKCVCVGGVLRGVGGMGGENGVGQMKHSAAQVMLSLSSKTPTREVRLNVELALNLVYFPLKTCFY